MVTGGASVAYALVKGASAAATQGIGMLGAIAGGLVPSKVEAAPTDTTDTTDSTDGI